MYTTLPTSPIRTVKKCNKCPNFHVEFFNTKFNRTYTPEEWEQIVTEGREFVRTTVIEFSSFEKAKNFFYSSEYQAAHELLKDTVVRNHQIIEGN